MLTAGSAREDILRIGILFRLSIWLALTQQGTYDVQTPTDYSLIFILLHTAKINRIKASMLQPKWQGEMNPPAIQNISTAMKINNFDLPVAKGWVE